MDGQHLGILKNASCLYQHVFLIYFSAGILNHSSFDNCSGLTKLSRLFWERSTGYWNKIWTRWWSLQNSAAHCLWNFGCHFLCALVILLLRDPRQSLMETLLSDTGLDIVSQNSLAVFKYHNAMHAFKSSTIRISKATPKKRVNLHNVWPRWPCSLSLFF